MDRLKGKLYQMDMRAVPIEGSAKHRVTTRQLYLDFASLKRLNDNLNEFQGRFGISISLGLRCPLARLIDGPVTGLDALLIERGNSAPTAHVFVDRQSIVGRMLAVVNSSSVSLA